MVDLHVGARIRASRRAAALSQHELAAKVGVTFQQIQKYERGANRVSASMLFEIAAALEVPVADFFSGLDGASFRAGPSPVQQVVDRLMGDDDGAKVAEAFPRIEPPTLRKVLAQLLTAMADATSAASRQA